MNSNLDINRYIVSVGHRDGTTDIDYIDARTLADAKLGAEHLYPHAQWITVEEEQS
jgi:L-rhamnose isomerase